MNVSVSFSDKIEGALRRQAAAVGKDVATFVQEIVTEQVAEIESESTANNSREGFAERSAAWIKLHPVLDHAIDDSRESIYSGREE